MIYIDYIISSNNTYIIKAIDLQKNQRTPYSLTEVIATHEISRLDIPYRVLMSNQTPVLDKNYNLTEFGKCLMDCLVENKAYPSSTGYNVRPRFTFSGDKNSASYYNKLEEVLKEMRLEDPIYFFKERVLSHMTVLHNILICLNYGVSYTDGGSIAISIENEAESDKSRVILTRYLYHYNIKGKLFGRSKSSILSISQLISMLNDAVSSSLDLTSVERSLYIDLIRIINGKYG